jgi:hypothetical protein
MFPVGSRLFPEKFRIGTSDKGGNSHLLGIQNFTIMACQCLCWNSFIQDIVSGVPTPVAGRKATHRTQPESRVQRRKGGRESLTAHR